MIAIIDYGVGNLFSLRQSFSAVGSEAVVTSDESVIDSAERVILPGVGAFADAAMKLRRTGLGDVLCRQVRSGKPVMGICLGMQLLFEKSYEFGVYDGLGLLKGEVVQMAGIIPAGLKIPHIGWNALRIVNPSPILKYVKDGDHVYFVHSFHAVGCEDSLTAQTEYGMPLTAAVGKENLFGCQFHPEKSGKVGLSILKAFCETEGCI